MCESKQWQLCNGTMHVMTLSMKLLLQKLVLSRKKVFPCQTNTRKIPKEMQKCATDPEFKRVMDISYALSVWWYSQSFFFISTFQIFLFSASWCSRKNRRLSGVRDKHMEMIKNIFNVNVLAKNSRIFYRQSSGKLSLLSAKSKVLFGNVTAKNFFKKKWREKIDKGRHAEESWGKAEGRFYWGNEIRPQSIFIMSCHEHFLKVVFSMLQIKWFCRRCRWCETLNDKTLFPTHQKHVWVSPTSSETAAIARCKNRLFGVPLKIFFLWPKQDG